MIAFAQPFAFAFSALIGVLVLLYLWQQPRRRVVVPSLLLWEGLRDHPVRSARFLPDWLFFLRLLILLLLIAGLARPYLPQAGNGFGGRRHIVVLDTTASMQAREPDGTRFDLARQQAQEFLDSLDEGDEAMLIAAGPSPSVLCDVTRDRHKLRQALADARAVDVGGDLGAALAFADGARQRSPLPAHVVVFSDLTYGELPAAARDRITLFQIGRADENVAVESIQVQQGRFQGPAAAHAQIQVRNFSPRETHGLLTVAVEGTTVARHGFTLAAQESRRFQASGFPRAGRLVARLENEDALPVDNTAWAWVREARSLRVLLVTAPTALATDFRQLARAGGMRLTVVDPASYDAAAAGDFDVVVFHRQASSPAVTVNALYIDPPTDNDRFSVTGTASTMPIVDWEASHPILQGMAVQPLRPLKRARAVVPPPGSEVLLRSRTTEGEAAVAFAVERDQHREACFSFDLEAEQLLGNDSTPWLLLLLGTLDWLAPDLGEVVVTRTGVAATLETHSRRDTAQLTKEPLRITDPRGHTQQLDATASIFEPHHAGVHTVQFGDRQTWLFANFADPQESSIAVPLDDTEAATLAARTDAAREVATSHVAVGTELGRWLWLLAAVLLAIEWWASTRRHATAAGRVGTTA